MRRPWMSHRPHNVRDPPGTGHAMRRPWMSHRPPNVRDPPRRADACVIPECAAPRPMSEVRFGSGGAVCLSARSRAR